MEGLRLKLDKKSMLLYVVTDRTWLGENKLDEQVEAAIKGGATFIQLREKNLAYDIFVREALKIKKVTDKHAIPFVINDNVQVALEVDADGVHVGQSDAGAREVRRLIGENKILGVSVQTVEDALLAEQNGADYIGVGAVFNTSTKLDANTLPFDTLKDICRAVTIPVVAIGGISEENVLELRGSGAAGIAVISAVFAKPDIFKASQTLCNLAKEMVRE
ncbi:MAG: hypothetical protein K0S71_1055 [Clostridia bacterium]|jgi:thiamine-phosphate pyrophosphorylase|nr:hypothetical protein [Clostridia bacterium]